MLVGANRPTYFHDQSPYTSYDPYHPKVQAVYPRYQPRADYADYAYDEESYPTEPINYEFQYGVRDDYTGQDFKHSENHEGDKTSGSYEVALPDGRTQVVTYTADDNGYNADVIYQGDNHQSTYPHRVYPLAEYQKPHAAAVPDYQPAAQVPEAFPGSIFRAHAPTTAVGNDAEDDAERAYKTPYQRPYHAHRPAYPYPDQYAQQRSPYDVPYPSHQDRYRTAYSRRY